MDEADTPAAATEVDAFKNFVEMSDNVARRCGIYKTSDIVEKVVSIMLHGQPMAVNDIESELLYLGVESEPNTLEQALVKGVSLGILEKAEDSGMYHVAKDISKIFKMKSRRRRRKKPCGSGGCKKGKKRSHRKRR